MRLLILAVPLLALVACGGGRSELPSPTTRTQNATVTPAPTRQDRTTAPSIASQPADSAETETAVVLPPKPVMPDDFPQPDILMDSTKRDIRERLGEPDFIRRDMGAELWQYRVDACILDIFLYRDGTGFVTKHIDMRPQSDRFISAQACFWSLHPDQKNAAPDPA